MILDNYKNNKGSIDFLMILPLFIILLWGVAFLILVAQKQNKANAHVWSAGISKWNGENLKTYQKNISSKNGTVKKNTSLDIEISMFKKLPVAFKLFEVLHSRKKISYSSKHELPKDLNFIRKHLNIPSFSNINTTSESIFPNFDKRKKKSKMILKNGLWLFGMCDAKFTELYLPALGLDLFLQVAAGVKLPNIYPVINNIPLLECSS